MILRNLWKNVFCFLFCGQCCSFSRVESKKKYNGLNSANFGLTLQIIVYLGVVCLCPLITMKYLNKV